MSATTTVQLSKAMRNAMWRMAQHRYAYAYVLPRERVTYDGLARRGLCIDVEASGTNDCYALTDVGLDFAQQHWPVSPAVLCTYDHQPDGWTPKAGVNW